MKLNKLLSIYYIWILIIPVIIYCLYKFDNQDMAKPTDFHFFTSIKSSHCTKINFLKNDSLLIAWQNNFTNYKQLEYVQPLEMKNDSTFQLKIEHQTISDTISFLGINFFINNELFTLAPSQLEKITVSKNAKIIHHHNQLKIISTTNDPITISLNNPTSWSTNSIRGFKLLILISLSVLFIIVVIALKPLKKWFLLSLSITVFFIFYFWTITKDPIAHLTINHCKPKDPITYYYNSIPSFSSILSSEYRDSTTINKTQTFPEKFNFYRIDFAPYHNKLIQNEVKYSMGVINKKWKLGEINPFDITGNDIDYENEKYYLCGDDSYLCLSSVLFNNGFKKVNFIRSSIYVVFSLIVFIILLMLSNILKKYKNEQIIILSSFLILICCSGLYVFVNEPSLIMNEEKRLAYSKPVYSDSIEIKRYFKLWDLYLKDQLPGRSSLITLNNYCKYTLFKEVATSPLVHFGKKDWMFYTGENVKDVYENKKPLTEVQLKKMTQILESRDKWLAKKGITYYLIFPRLSHYFYNENVGKGLFQYNKKARLDQLLEYLKNNTNLKVIDIYTPMLEAKKNFKRDLYYHTDSHWNLFGAYFAYSATIKRIQKDFPNMKSPIPLTKITWIEMESQEADLAKLVSLNKTITRHEYIPSNKEINNASKVVIPSYPEYNSIHPMVFYQGKNDSAPKVIMNRDSYSNFLIPYFSSHFSRQGYLWSPLFFSSIIEKEKPDIVITEMMERFIDDLLLENSTLNN